MDKDVAHHRAKVVGLKYAVIAGRRAPDDPELMAELGHLKAAGVKQRALKLLAELPELTPEDLVRITELLRSGIEEVSNGKG